MMREMFSELDVEKVGFFEMGPIRPPSEGGDLSLLIRATRNCPWNRCQFCPIYKDVKFEYRSVEEIEKDIDVVKALVDKIKKTSWMLGLTGKINSEVINRIIRGNQEIYVGSGDKLGSLRFQNLVNVANWLASGAKTVFLQDANTLIMRTPELVEVIRYLKESFPSIERVTSYARSKTCARKHLEELEKLHVVGLSRLHVGLESGCDEVLEEMQKGVSAAEHIEGGKKVVKSGISLSEYVMPGLGGREWSEKHALETARVLNEINPDFIRIRSLKVPKNAPLYQKLQAGEFEEPSEDEIIEEIELLIKNLNCDSYVASDHILNLLPEVEGKLPEAKERMLKVIETYKIKPFFEKLEFRLTRRLGDYARFRRLEPELNKKAQEAYGSIRDKSQDAKLKTDEAISALKEGFM